MYFRPLFIAFYFLFHLLLRCHSEQEILSIVQNDYEKHILLATISGNLHLFDKYSGEQIWKTKMEQFVKTHSTNGSMLIPNPISGQLYIFQQNSNDHDLFTPLEHSLYEYVRQTPVFMENMLLTGSKNDHWLSLDMDTGKVINKYRTGGSDNCPQYDTNKDTINNHTLHIGICQYNLVVSDSTTRHIMYNVIMNSLATHAVTDLEHFGFQLYGSSDSGLVVAKYKSNGSEKGWSSVLDSSVIGFYAITKQGILSRLHFTTMSHDTIDHYLRPFPFVNNNMVFKKSMFFGHNNNNWYVLKAYISEEKPVRSVGRVILPLITGPINISYGDQHVGTDGPSAGFYEMPADIYPGKQNEAINVRYLLDFDKNHSTALVPDKFRKIIIKKLPKNLIRDSWPIMIIGTLVTATFIMTIMILYNFRRQNIKNIKKDTSNSKSCFTDLQRSFDDAAIDIGEVSYYPREVLGYGTNGTTVFKGVFHGNKRAVAVKRLIKSEQSHYELQFLRQSFDCSYLIKCFYITQSREFTFLALELCECTLEGYVMDDAFRDSCGLDNLTACKQMMSGVHFLHDKGIVHRDLKPRNVLLMKQQKVMIRPESKNESTSRKYKIVISDFGLSRQSLDHCLSITKTGCGGTSGYMAPELSREDVKRITTSADIFSCGILFYYIHTHGRHPFGVEILSRQHRILLGQFNLDEKLVEDPLLMYVISSMLQPNPSDRPTADEILNGPLFWKSFEKLSFLSDISDFVETADISLQISLDNLSHSVFSNKWTDELESELVENLTIKRGYNTKQLSHLIRALRNKRNHFHDLEPSLSETLFSSSLEGLSNYICRKFPHLYCTLYKWVRCNILHFSDSIHRYFPSYLYKDRLEEIPPLLNQIDGINPERELNQEDDLLEWRKPARKRPSQPKKHRGSKNINKNITS